jgi:hypothetical protein
LEHLVRLLITQLFACRGRPDTPVLARPKTKRHEGVIDCQFPATASTVQNYGSICRFGSGRACW